MDWPPLLNERMRDAYRVTDQLMSLVGDDELDWKPATGKNWMTTGQLLMHLTNACGFCCRGFATGDWGQPEGTTCEDTGDQPKLPAAETLPTVSTVAEARKLLDEDRILGLRILEEAGEERLASEMSAPPWDPDHPRSLGWHCLDMIGHLESHKSQLFYYLKLMGKDVNTMTLWMGT